MSIDKKLKVLMIGAHLDDNETFGGGTALQYLDKGHSVRFLSLCNGCGGHHENSPEVIVKRRYQEAQNVAKLTGLTYDVWNIRDCELVADLSTRKRLVRYIREFAPDIIFTHRPNDYHADHRAAALLVQDSSYLLIVPNFCRETVAMKNMPVIMYFADNFQNPPFRADIVVATDNVIDKKYQMYNCHVSQFYEWLPYTYGELDQVPKDKNERLEWLRSPRVPRDKPLTLEELLSNTSQNPNEYFESLPATKYRHVLAERYGQSGENVLFAEAFEVSEYGMQITKEKEKQLFPF